MVKFVMIILPMTSRSSSNLTPSAVLSNGRTVSIIGLNFPSEIIVINVSKSSGNQLLEPRIFNSKVQTYRKSVFGSKPAVAPQVSILPPRRVTLNEGTQVSPPVKLITTSTPPSNFRRCGLPNFVHIAFLYPLNSL